MSIIFISCLLCLVYNFIYLDMFAYMSVCSKFATVEGKMFADPEYQVFELICISKPEASVLDHTCSYFILFRVRVVRPLVAC